MDGRGRKVAKVVCVAGPFCATLPNWCLIDDLSCGKKKGQRKERKKKAAGRSHASPVRTCLRAEQCSTRAEDCVHFRYPCPANVERGSSCGTRQKVVKKTPVLARNCPAWA